MHRSMKATADAPTSALAHVTETRPRLFLVTRYGDRTLSSADPHRPEHVTPNREEELNVDQADDAPHYTAGDDDWLHRRR